MGNQLSVLIEKKAQEPEGAKVREQLDILMKLADARLDTFESELTTMFLDNESTAKRSVPGKRALRFERSVRVNCSETYGDDLASTIDTYFGYGGSKGIAKPAGVEKDALDAFKTVVNRGMTEFLTDTSVGESYDKKFFVCIKHNAIIRVDVYIYRYNFTQGGVFTENKYNNVLGYVLCTSVVDHTALTVDEIVFLASEFAGDQPWQYEAYLWQLIHVWRWLGDKKVTMDPAVQKEARVYTSRPKALEEGDGDASEKTQISSKVEEAKSATEAVPSAS
ncbi:hypothetical protein N7528_009994 [Penicillium herquei]|nr:hypothetical protein N7528_009994 [Penicillium herquei]